MSSPFCYDLPLAVLPNSRYPRPIFWLMTTTTNTHFAPAARSGGEEIEQAHRTLALDPVLTQSLDAVPEIVLILNENRQIILANQGACQAVRRRHPDMLGLRPGELFECENARMAPCGCGTGEACRNCGAVLAILEAQKGEKACRECRLLRQGAEGFEALDIRVDCRPFTSREERHTVFVATDISAEKRRDVLERIFFHDILNLAGGVESLASLLADGSLTLKDAKDDLCVSASAIVQEIRSQQLLLAAEKGQLALSLSGVESREFLLELRQAFRSHSVAAGREIIVAPDAGDFSLVTDRAILTRVMGNLVKNALEASPRGSRITLGCRADAGGGVFTCHNPGCMPPQVQLQMFQRSFSTKGRGRGIGTYSVRLLTENYLEGRVSFTSTANTGTIFEVALPYSPPMAAALAPGGAAR
jgi:signal transduction histidine kinase